MYFNTYYMTRDGSRLHSSLAPIWTSAHRRGAKSTFRRANAGVVHSAARLSENDRGMRISMDIPGVKSSDIKVQIHDGVLCVSGDRRVDEDTTWTFQKRFSIATDRIDTAEIKAHLADGVLVITAPKKQKNKQPQTIMVVEGEPKDAPEKQEETEENTNKTPETTDEGDDAN